MAQEVRTTKMLLDKRRAKLREFDRVESEYRKRNEDIRKEHEELSKANTLLNDRFEGLKNHIKILEMSRTLLLEDLNFIRADIEALYTLREAELKSIWEVYSCLNDKTEEATERFAELEIEAFEMHKKCVEEQDAIQSQKRDLGIYRERLQKKYDELNFGKVSLTE